MDNQKPRPQSVILERVTKAYGNHVVVEDVDLSIRAGEFVTLLGPSGSGKTTCLNMVAGFTDVTSGDIRIGGRSVTNLPSHKRDLGVVFQNYALFPHLTVAENVEYPLRRHGYDSRQRAKKVEEFLEIVELSGHAKKLPTMLSGGQQQRVALARALVYGPDVLLMDEPLGALDKKLREWLQVEIKRIHEEVGSTFLFVTHDQEEALSMSDRIAVFNDGKIEQFGSGQELYNSPATLFVGQFLGESSVFGGDVVASSDNHTALRVGASTVHAVSGSTGMKSPVILVRPEVTTLSCQDNQDSDTNSVAVDVVASSYLGAHWRFQIQLPDRTHGVVRSSNVPDGISVGNTAFLQWSPADSIVLDGGNAFGP